MPTYVVRDPQTGKTVRLTGDSPPTEAELTEMFATLGASPSAAPPAAPPARSWGETARDVATGVKDVAIGAAKQIAEDTSSVVGLIPGVTSATNVIGNVIGGKAAEAIHGPDAAGTPAVTPEQAAASLGAANPAQRVGKVGAAIAELAIPVTKGARAAKAVIPTRAKAGVKFQQVMKAAKNVPVNIDEAGNIALRIQELAERGATMPQAARKFLLRVTDPNKPPLTYGELRDFASNVSRLSALEMQKVGKNKPMLAEIHKLRVALNKAAAEAAGTVGERATYESAMKEFARASRTNETVRAAAKYGLGALGVSAGARLLGNIMGLGDGR